MSNFLNEMAIQEKTKAFMAEVEEIKNKFGVNMNSAIMTLVIYKLAEIERKLEQIESKKWKSDKHSHGEKAGGMKTVYW